MTIKHAFATAFLNVGLSVGMRADLSAARALIARLHPLVTEHPLIRLGGRADGGYLVPDDFDGIAACFSPGVDNRVSFERSLIERGIPCYLADASVDRVPLESDKVHFLKKYVGTVNDDTTITLDDWVDANVPGNADLILQMDIEGAEWTVLLNVSRGTLRRFRIIVVELHNLERLLDKYAFPIIKAMFDRLLQDFYVVHSHPNNYGGKVRCQSLVIPRALEMTFIRKDRVRSTQFARTFPHPLDAKNHMHWPDLPLPPSWFTT
jgi:hypothetical protein